MATKRPTAAEQRLLARPMVSPEQLNRWRYARRISQKRLAELLGMAPATVNNWENGHTRIPPWLDLCLSGLDQLTLVDFDRVNLPR